MLGNDTEDPALLTMIMKANLDSDPLQRSLEMI